MYVGVKMKKSQLRNIIKQVITEQMQPVAHKSIMLNVCGCIDKLNAPLTFGGSTYCDGPLPQSGMAGFNAFGSNMGPVTAFQCDGMPCTQQHVTSGQIFSLKIYGAYPNNNDHVATLFGSLIYYALPTNTLNSNPYQGVEQLMPSSCPTGPGHLHTNLDNDRDNPGYIPPVDHLDNDRDNPGYKPPVDHLDNDRDLPSGVDCRKFWSNPSQAQICCRRCEDLNLHPLTHPNHSCSKWCECCTSPR